MNEFVILVDEHNYETGVMAKLEAHVSGVLHRAFSVFIFNSRGEVLLQQRAAGKYHSANLWSNTCCSHPRPFEPVDYAAFRRLYEEMGLICQLEEKFSFIYKADLGNGLWEHEFDHVFVGYTDALPLPLSSEVADFKWVTYDWLVNDVRQNPDNYTVWFKICLEQHGEKIFKTLANQGKISLN